MKTPILMAAIAAGLMATTADARGGDREALMGPEEMIEQLDANGDGALSPDEFRTPAQGIFAMMDANGDGALTAAEAEAAATDRVAERVGRMIERLDTNADGTVSEAEFTVVRRGPSAEQMFERIDGDSDGLVTLAELEEARDGFRDRFGRAFGRRGN